jgi:hypothetical protein
MQTTPMQSFSPPSMFFSVFSPSGCLAAIICIAAVGHNYKRHTPEKHQARECAGTCSTFVPIPSSSIVVLWLRESTLMQTLPDTPSASTMYGGLSPPLGGISTLPRTASTATVTCIRGILAVMTHLGCPRFRSGSLQPELVSASQSRRLIPIRSSIVTAVTAIGNSLITSMQPTAIIDVSRTQPTRTQISRTRLLVLVAGSLEDKKVSSHILEAEQPFFPAASRGYPHSPMCVYHYDCTYIYSLPLWLAGPYVIAR